MAERIKTLIIDKDETSRNLLISLLIKRGHVVYFSTTGSDGVQKILDNNPDIVICDTDLSDQSIPELIQRLASSNQTASIPIVAISGRSNAEEMKACLDLGCAEYYGKSGLNLIGLIDAIPGIIARAENKKREASKNGLLIVFLSAKGGSGTSSLCANISACLAKNMAPSTVVAADLVLPMGSIASIVGYTDPFDICDIASMPASDINPTYFQKNLIIPPGWNFHLLPGCPDPGRAENLNAKQIPDIVEMLTKTYDYTLIDFGRALSKISIPVIQKADVIVLVMGTDKMAVELTKKMVAYLSSIKIERDHIFIILNRAVGLEGLSKMEAEQIIGVPIRLTIPYMMSNLTLANNQHVPVPVKYPTDTVTMMLNQASNEISSQAIKISKVKS